MNHQQERTLTVETAMTKEETKIAVMFAIIVSTLIKKLYC